MAPARTPPPALRLLLDTGAQLVRRSAAARIGLARGAGLIDPAALPVGLREPAERVLAAARREACIPLELATIERALRGAWGRRPAMVLDELDPEPLAVGAAAQVHRAVLGGEPVVVKVLRPGVETVVRNDLALLDALALPLAVAFGALDAGMVLRELRATALDELDLEEEGDAQRRVARALRRAPGLAAPGVDSELTRSGVLVSGHVPGPTLADGLPGDTAAIARRLITAHLGVARTLRLACADPRPNHVLLASDDTTVLLGMGATRPLPAERLDAALDALAALRDDDADSFAAATGRAGLLPDGAARGAHALLRGLLGDLVRGPARLDADAVRGVLERGSAAIDELVALGGAVRPAATDLGLARMLGQLCVVLARLGATEDWIALVVAAGRDGLDDPAVDSLRPR